MSDEVPAVEVRDLTKTYSSGVRAIDSIGFQVPAGSVCGLLGPNGAGKSTTVKILTTLTRPDSGVARVAGVDVVAAPGRVRGLIGCVAQRSGADPAATGRENLILQGRLYGMRGAPLTERVDELLDRFGLTGWSDRLARTYPGGLRRKLDVALGLVHRPLVLFLDEPTTGLDLEARAELRAEVAEQSARGVTVILTTHSLEEADELAHTIVILDRGRVVATGTPGQLRNGLHGDMIHVRLALPAAPTAVKLALSSLRGVDEIEVRGRELNARVEHAACVPDVLGALESAGLRVSSLMLSTPTLDDVYREHAGRTRGLTREVSGR